VDACYNLFQKEDNNEMHQSSEFDSIAEADTDSAKSN
jgi:hypothetical protein